jgi:hypothetical protein
MIMTQPVGPSSAVRPAREVADPTGALVVYAEPNHHGIEIDVCRIGGIGFTHSPVLQRRLGGRTVYCAVYPGLAVGQYQVIRPDRTVATTVNVLRGRITEVPADVLT